jgi:hypothetical protein
MAALITQSKLKYWNAREYSSTTCLANWLENYHAKTDGRLREVPAAAQFPGGGERKPTAGDGSWRRGAATDQSLRRVSRGGTRPAAVPGRGERRLTNPCSARLREAHGSGVIPWRLAGRGGGGASLGSLCAVFDRESAEARLDRYWGPDGSWDGVFAKVACAGGRACMQRSHVTVGPALNDPGFTIAWEHAMSRSTGYFACICLHHDVSYSLIFCYDKILFLIFANVLCLLPTAIVEH